MLLSSGLMLSHHPITNLAGSPRKLIQSNIKDLDNQKNLCYCYHCFYEPILQCVTWQHKQQNKKIKKQTKLYIMWAVSKIHTKCRFIGFVVNFIISWKQRSSQYCITIFHFHWVLISDPVTNGILMRLQQIKLFIGATTDWIDK